MILSKKTLKDIKTADLLVPDEGHFELPEKVLQFGTGVLLRGLPDYFMDKANKKGLFNGRIVVVKSTGAGDTTEFDQQDSLYTICVRGVEQGKDIRENIISAAISRVLTADQDWQTILNVGRSPELKLIVSNTTEVGISLLEESIFQNPPVSFPAKLLAVLYKRYKEFGYDPCAELVVIATELIPDNGKRLETIVLELSKYNELEEGFVTWLKAMVHFCNSLVDRIVPGKPEAELCSRLEEGLCYSDPLLIMTEPYRLWAIEGDEKIAELLGLEGADPGLIIKPDIQVFRELKVRLLNGVHTLSCAVSFLSGIATVAEAMRIPALKNYMSKLMFDEIVTAIPYAVDMQQAKNFAAAVLDRFANPFIEHQWLNITFQYTMKMKVRVLPILFHYVKLYEKIPENISFGFATFLRFMHADKKREGRFLGTYQEREYPVNDDYACYFYKKSELNGGDYVREVLTDQRLWECDLESIPGFIDAVTAHYRNILTSGMPAALNLTLQEATVSL